MGNLAVVPRLDPLIPYMPVPCLPVLVKNQRRMRMLDVGLDHSLGVVGSSARQAGVITGPHGPAQASAGGHCGNDGRGQPTVMRKGGCLARRTLRRACTEGNIYVKYLLLSRQ